MTASKPPTDIPPKPTPRLLWTVLKWSLCLVVLGFVGKRAYDLWGQNPLEQVRVDFVWLIPAGCVYLIGWLPSVWFWRKLMTSLGANVSAADCTRAYYCGHLGKYVPGKALVLVIRTALVKNRGARPAIAALTATYETLLMMGAGLAVGISLLPITGWPNWLKPLAAYPFVPPLVVLGGCLLLLPVLARLLTWVAVRMTPREMIDSAPPIQIPAKLIAAGLGAFVLSWTLHGLSLGLILRSVSPGSFDLADWPLWTGAVSIATAIGFLMIFAPGGVGVREGLLIVVLQIHPQIGLKQSVAAAVLLRLVWLIAEIASAAVLYYSGTVSKPSDGNQ